MAGRWAEIISAGDYLDGTGTGGGGGGGQAVSRSRLTRVGLEGEAGWIESRAALDWRDGDWRLELERLGGQMLGVGPRGGPCLLIYRGGGATW